MRDNFVVLAVERALKVQPTKHSVGSMCLSLTECGRSYNRQRVVMLDADWGTNVAYAEMVSTFVADVNVRVERVTTQFTIGAKTFTRSQPVNCLMNAGDTLQVFHRLQVDPL